MRSRWQAESYVGRNPGLAGGDAAGAGDVAAMPRRAAPQQRPRRPTPRQACSRSRWLAPDGRLPPPGPAYSNGLRRLAPAASNQSRPGPTPLDYCQRLGLRLATLASAETQGKEGAAAGLHGPARNRGLVWLSGEKRVEDRTPSAERSSAAATALNAERRTGQNFRRTGASRSSQSRSAPEPRLCVKSSPVASPQQLRPFI